MRDVNVLVEIRFGSHLYGTDTAASDLDLKGIYLPGAREIVLGTAPPVIIKSRPKQTFERNSKDDVDRELFSVQRFLRDLMDGQTWALDMLFGCSHRSGAWYEARTPAGQALMETLLDNRRRLLTRGVTAFVGYARQQAARYGIKGSRLDALRRAVGWLEARPAHDRVADHRASLEALVAECAALVALEHTPLVEIVELPGPAGTVPHLRVCGRHAPLPGTIKHALEMYRLALDQYGQRARKANLAGGVDWKALSHAVRVNAEAVELLTTAWITFPRPDRALLVDIKAGRLEPERVYAMIEEGLAQVHAARERSDLPEVPDRAWADALVCDLYGAVVRA